VLVDEGLELLTDAEARDLLRQGEVGRVGLTLGAMPAIFPVNYAVIDGDIVFRTAPGSKLAAAADRTVVAFEVDDYDRHDRSGWSVLVLGQSEVVDDVDATYQALKARVKPWADGNRTSLVRIHPEFVSGRRIVHAAG
jgi:uncharacterized protein